MGKIQGVGPKAFLAFAVLTCVVLGTWWSASRRPTPAVPATNVSPPAQAPNFLESADAAGLNFQMKFLPGEQGAKFKTNLYDHGSGLAIGDYDGDGWDDIYFLNQLGDNGLFRNRGDGTFADVTDQAGVGLGDRICVAACFADYDNDGDQDLFVTSTRGGNVLFRNDGSGKFQDVTTEAGVAYVGHSQSCLFFDYDNDGWLDLYVTSTAKWTTDEFDAAERHFVGIELLEIFDLDKYEREPSHLYRNQGDGTFADVTETAGVAGARWNNDCLAFDYDADGWQDLLVTNMYGRSPLYRNLGDGRFEDVSAAVLGPTPLGGMGGKVLDFNNDGLLDLLILDMHSDMWMRPGDAQAEALVRTREKAKLGLFPLVGLSGRKLEINDPKVDQVAHEVASKWDVPLNEIVFGNAFYKNLGDGKFEDVTDATGMETFWPWGSAAGDFDNDGYEDLYIASGMGYPFFYWPNQLMMNQAGKRFVNRIRDVGIEPPAGGIYLPEQIGGMPATRSSRAAAVADFDGDGRLEIVTNNFNDKPYYLKNNFPQNSYLAFDLRGTVSNRDAIGAVVRVHAGQQIFTRQVSSSGGYLTQSSKRLHVGLGNLTAVDFVEIAWPKGRTSRIDAPELNKRHNITEPSAQ